MWKSGETDIWPIVNYDQLPGEGFVAEWAILPVDRHFYIIRAFGTIDGTAVAGTSGNKFTIGIFVEAKVFELMFFNSRRTTEDEFFGYSF